MAEMLLINPRRRSGRKTRKATAKRRRTTARRKNPISVATVRRRRHNPIRAKRRVSRRRRNPIGGKILSGGLMKMIQEAFVGAAGSVAVDVAYGQIQSYLPASLRRTPGQVGVGDVVKAAITVGLGSVLAKPTKGLSKRMAAGALTVQAAELLKSFVPSTMQLGYIAPARVVPGTNRVGPMRRGGVSEYVAPGATPMLSAYSRPGVSPILNGSRDQRTAQMREGVSAFR